MTFWEAVTLALTGGGAVKAIDFAVALWKARGKKKSADARVAIAEIGADTAALQILVGQIDELREEGRREREECRRSHAELAAELAEVKRAGEECEKRAAGLQRQLNRLRSWLRKDADERDDLTPVEVPAGKERTR